MQGEQPSTQLNSPKTNKQKIIILILGHIFIILLIVVAWDLYGRNVLCTNLNTNNTQGLITPAAQNPKPTGGKESSTEEVDSSLYATCTSKISDERIYKDCCDALNADDTVKKACKKIVDDTKQVTPTPN